MMENQGSCFYLMRCKSLLCSRSELLSLCSIA
jgi:hypothetical protein